MGLNPVAPFDKRTKKLLAVGCSPILVRVDWPIMRKKIFMLAVILIVVLLIGAGFVAYRVSRAILGGRGMQVLPAQLKVARILRGQDQFSKQALFTDPTLGTITDFEQQPNGELLVVGQSGAAFLTPSGSISRSTHFLKCNSDVVAVELGIGRLLCRGTWNTNTALFDLNGKVLWSYSGGMQGIDDADAGDLGPNGSEKVVVGFNGSGGVRLLSSEGKELWTREDGNVWHVAIVASGGSSSVIVHSNAGGEITVRDPDGNVLSRNKPELYLSSFVMTAWGDNPSRNKVMASEAGSIYILALNGKTLARLPAPTSARMAQPKGTQVHFSRSEPYFAALLRYFLWERSILYIYDSQEGLIYHEILDRDCDAVNASRDSQESESLLLGCDSTVWKYSRVRKQ